MPSTTKELPKVRYLTSGRVTDAELAAAEGALRSALAGVSGRIGSVALTLSVVADETLPRPALAQAVVEIDGRRLRAQAAAPTLPEAIGLLRDRLAVRASSFRQVG
ncbi:hypothetical protein Acsp03_54890 [Actinomadura sp. NBRC 104412]|uniref:hypothetical protein n=1 Tax=Actinomadura sp. NBRC 104412 TaxID=3032203 RepID=UPI0024A4747D|nr:hypothetical protein [Actinomadura sp. NBRC 104412]GLZ08023.1 hypothetical protein Acsp03_54890 [Actinomadura sp. NBRC 104412]